MDTGGDDSVRGGAGNDTLTGDGVTSTALEREVAAREAEAQRRLGDERLRIAREVHDVVAHSMVAINVQAGVAAHCSTTTPTRHARR